VASAAKLYFKLEGGDAEVQALHKASGTQLSLREWQGPRQAADEGPSQANGRRSDSPAFSYTH